MSDEDEYIESDEIDGCLCDSEDSETIQESITLDEELPAAYGGVA
ncbi:hypothetical protein ACJJIU_08185 [Microbulbifer sp. CnH-101-E]